MAAPVAVPPPPDRAAVLAMLRARVARLEATLGGRPADRAPAIPVAAPVDGALPDGGLARGAVHEVAASEEDGSGPAFGFAALVCARAGGTTLWIEPKPSIWPEGAAAFGLDPAALAWWRPTAPTASGRPRRRCAAPRSGRSAWSPRRRSASPRGGGCSSRRNGAARSESRRCRRARSPGRARRAPGGGSRPCPAPPPAHLRRRTALARRAGGWSCCAAAAADGPAHGPWRGAARPRGWRLTKAPGRRPPPIA
jgi:hypothetical protein